MKKFLKLFVPPLLVAAYTAIRRMFKKPYCAWSGDYASWAQARAHCTGYEAADVVEKCKDALLKVKNGEAACERDSVLFDTVQYSWPLLAGLMWAAARNGGVLSVLDLGGSLGTTYYQNKKFLDALKNVEWSIVEQAGFVACGKKHFENDTVKFFDSIDACLMQRKPNVIVLSGVLQYFEDPYALLREVVDKDFPTVIIDRTPFVQRLEKDRLTVQVVPSDVYRASYPAWFLSKKKFMQTMSKAYAEVEAFSASDGVVQVMDMRVEFKGAIFVRKDC